MKTESKLLIEKYRWYRSIWLRYSEKKNAFQLWEDSKEQWILFFQGKLSIVLWINDQNLIYKIGIGEDPRETKSWVLKDLREIKKDNIKEIITTSVTWALDNEVLNKDDINIDTLGFLGMHQRFVMQNRFDHIRKTIAKLESIESTVVENELNMILDEPLQRYIIPELDILDKNKGDSYSAKHKDVESLIDEKGIDGITIYHNTLRKDLDSEDEDLVMKSYLALNYYKRVIMFISYNYDGVYGQRGFTGFTVGMEEQRLLILDEGRVSVLFVYHYNNLISIFSEMGVDSFNSRNAFKRDIEENNTLSEEELLREVLERLHSRKSVFGAAGLLKDINGPKVDKMIADYKVNDQEDVIKRMLRDKNIIH